MASGSSMADDGESNVTEQHQHNTELKSPNPNLQLQLQQEDNCGSRFNSGSNKTSPEYTAMSSSAVKPPSGYKPYVFDRNLTGHTGLISCVKFSADGAYLASSSLDRSLIIWSVKTLIEISRLKGHSDGIHDLAWSPNSLFICSGSEDKTVLMWDVKAGELRKIFRPARGYPVMCVNFNSDSTNIVSGSSDGKIRVWKVRDKHPLLQIGGRDDNDDYYYDDGYSKVTSVQFNRAGTYILSASIDSCKIWHANSGDLYKTIIATSNGAVVGVSCAQFILKDNFALVSTIDSSIQLWIYMSETPALVKTFEGHEHTEHVITAALSSTNSDFVVSGSEDKTIYLWDFKTRNIAQKLEGHTAVVRCVACHPMKNMIASAGIGEDRTIKVWSQPK